MSTFGGRGPSKARGPASEPDNPKEKKPKPATEKRITEPKAAAPLKGITKVTEKKLEEKKRKESEKAHMEKLEKHAEKTGMQLGGAPRKPKEKEQPIGGTIQKPKKPPPVQAPPAKPKKKRADPLALKSPILKRRSAEVKGVAAQPKPIPHAVPAVRKPYEFTPLPPRVRTPYVPEGAPVKRKEPSWEDPKRREGGTKFLQVGERLMLEAPPAAAEEPPQQEPMPDVQPPPQEIPAPATVRTHRRRASVSDLPPETRIFPPRGSQGSIGYSIKEWEENISALNTPENISLMKDRPKRLTMSADILKKQIEKEMELKAEQQNVTNKMSDIQEKISSTDPEVAQQLESLKQENASLIESMNKQREIDLENQRTELINESNRRNLEDRALNEEKFNEERRSLTSSLKEKEAKINQLSNYATQVKEKLTENEQEITRLKNTQLRFQQQLDEREELGRRREAEASQRKLQELESERQKIEEKVKNLTASKIKGEKAYEELSKLKNQEINNLTTQAGEKISQLTKEKENLSTKLNELQEQVKEADNTIKDKDEQIKTLKTAPTVVPVEKQNEIREAERLRLEGIHGKEINEARNLIAQQRQDINTIRDDHGKLYNRYVDAVNNLHKNNEVINRLTQENEALKKQATAAPIVATMAEPPPQGQLPRPHAAEGAGPMEVEPIPPPQQQQQQEQGQPEGKVPSPMDILDVPARTGPPPPVPIGRPEGGGAKGKGGGGDLDCAYAGNQFAKVLIEIVRISSNGKTPGKGLVDEAYNRFQEFKRVSNEKKGWVLGGCSSTVPEGAASMTASTSGTKKSRKSAQQFTKALSTFINGLEMYDDISAQTKDTFSSFAHSCPQGSRVWILLGCGTVPNGASTFKI